VVVVSYGIAVMKQDDDIPSCSCRDAPTGQLGHVRQLYTGWIEEDHTVTTDGIGKAGSHKAYSREEPHLEA
jgi:hypothetical protein